MVPPLIGVVVVNFNGGETTMGCLAQLRNLTWPSNRLRIVLVDNASSDDVASKVERRWPDVTVVRSGRNVGFGGACNLAFDRLAEVDHIALVNNDAVPEPGWLEPLVAALESDGTVGAVTPKVLLASKFVEVTIDAPTSSAGLADGRALGVQVLGASVDGELVERGLHHASGFWGPERDGKTGQPFRWTSGSARLLVPIATGLGSVRLTLTLRCVLTDRGAVVSVGDLAEEVEVGPEPVEVTLVSSTGGVDLVNNAGTLLRADGSSADRGFLEPDGPRFDREREVFGWSGAAVLLRRAFLEDAGGFYAPLFLYYEDTELSWRGRRLGWTYRYIPSSVVRHGHSSTTGSTSELTRHLWARNRLATLILHAPIPLAGGAVATVTADLCRAAWRDVVVRLFTLRRPVTTHLKALVRVLAGLVRLLPGLLARRREVGRRAVVGWDRLGLWIGSEEEGDSFDRAAPR